MTVIEMNPMPRTADSPPRALVTLSHPSDRRTAEDALSRHGFSVRTTDDRRAATALLLTYSPDVIVEIPRNACHYHEFWRARELIRLGRERAAAALRRIAASGIRLCHYGHLPPLNGRSRA